MASSSSSSCISKYRVFTSFHGPDVRQTFLSHLRKQFKHNGITMFDDQGMERCQLIAPALTRAIRASKIFIIVLSKNYASSSWCLDELLEILKCNGNGHRVMTVFHGVDPSDVRKQTKDFGIAFNETCARRTEEEKIKWSQALNYVGNIAGEHFKNWKNEAEMIEKIAREVSDKLNVTPSRDFKGMVGLEVHLRKMESLLELDYDGVKSVGISGPAGIGKTTIGRALHSRLSSSFPLSCFMDNLRGHYLVEYGSKLRFQTQLLSEILNQDGIKIDNLSVIQERLHDQKVLIILDDVEHLDQLETLANTDWFGPGSRIIVTTENKEILQQHGINDIYHVGFPSGNEALKIFCLYAFRQSSPPDGFMDLAYEVARICGRLPLGLHVLGLLLRGKTQDDWIDELPRLKNCLDGRIESVLKVGYESLHEKDKTLFLFIANFFSNEHVDHVTSMLAKTNLDVRYGLKVLANKYLIHIDHGPESKVVMHRLLQVMARQVISSQEPWKRQILVDAQEICYVLENAAGTGSIVGVSFDVADINKLIISARAFERMCNLLFLKVYSGRPTQERQLHIPEEMEFLPCLRLLCWDAYPRKSLPSKFCPENLVKMNMRGSQLQKLWEGTQPLANLKKMKLYGSTFLKELPNLSKAKNLEKLELSLCDSLVEIPSSIVNLHKLVDLIMDGCSRLEVIPSLINLASLEEINMYGCSRLRSFPDIPTNVWSLDVTWTLIEELPASLRHCFCLEDVNISGSRNLKTFLTHLPTSVTRLDLSSSGIERITDCIRGLHNLRFLGLSSCKRLTSLPELPCSLKYIEANNCESLERVHGPLKTPNAKLSFTNCFKLGRQARRAIIQQSFVKGRALLPGREVPAVFDHRARGNSLTFPHSGFNRFKVCVVISPNCRQATNVRIRELLYRCLVICNSVNSDAKKFNLSDAFMLQKAHLFIFDYSLPPIESSEVSRKLVIQFSTRFQYFDIVGCGVKILTDETEENNNGGSGNEDDDSDISDTDESDEEEDDDEIISNSESDKEEDEEGYKSESGEASEDKDEKTKILSDKTDGSNNGGSGDEDDDNGIWVTHESDKEEDDSMTNSESGEASDKEDDEEGYKFEYGEASEDKDDDSDVSDTDESDKEEDDDEIISNSESDKEDDKEGHKFEYGEAYEDKDEDMADVRDYKSIATKGPMKRKMTSATTSLKKWILCHFLFLFFLFFLFAFSFCFC